MTTIDREKLIKDHQRLVYSIANKWKGRGVEFLDLVQEGNIGLLTALKHFDPDKGTQFSTYAYYWVKKCIRDAVYNFGSTVRVPINKQESEHKKRQMCAKLNAKYGANLVTENDPRLCEFDDTEYTDKSVDVSFDSTYEDVENMQAMVEAFSTLTWPEALVLRFRKFDGKSLQECGEDLNLCRQRISQIEKAAVEKIKSRVSFTNKFLK